MQLAVSPACLPPQGSNPFRETRLVLALAGAVLTGNCALFRNLRLGQGPVPGFPENFPKIIFPRLWNGPKPGTMLGNSNEQGF